MSKNSRALRTRTPGFTLIEILVVVTIIVILIGITVPIAMRMRDNASGSRTKNMLGALAATAEEYQLRTGSPVDHTTTTNPDLWIRLFVNQAKEIETCKDMLLALGKDKVVSLADGAEFVNDPWGNTIRYAKAVSYTDTFTADDTLPANPRPFFASAGPDGKWGSANKISATPAQQAEAKDNLYSSDRN